VWVKNYVAMTKLKKGFLFWPSGLFTRPRCPGCVFVVWEGDYWCVCSTSALLLLWYKSSL